MIEQLHSLLLEHRQSTYLLFRRYAALDKRLLQWADIVHEYDEFCQTEGGADLSETDLGVLLGATYQAVQSPPLICLAVRLSVANWRYVEIHAEEMRCREITGREYLEFKERLVEDSPRGEQWVVEVDLSPFERGFPKLTEARSIGRGVEYLNRYLAGRLFDAKAEGSQRLLEFLRVHQVRGRQLMLSGAIQDVHGLRQGVRDALDVLQNAEDEAEWATVEPDLRTLGFEPGWGRTVAQIRDMMENLSSILEAPSAAELERFLAHVPMIFSITILSPHGFFGQSGVLGKPDTGGQVVYILDQVRALESEMRRAIYDHGLHVLPQIVVVTRLIPEAEGTSCNERLEPIIGTRHARILRIPFRDTRGEMVPHWISRFHIWPYLERFAVDVERELLADLGGKPDMVIGNYSDGNLVASILAHRLGVTQCNIAHALEKTKYPHSDLYWRDHEDEHHFATQYTADLISMNTADFIISSTYQEIAGTKDSVGQYESYRAFTMPGLYRVVSGIDCFDPKFNIVSPGADAEVFFPFSATDRRSLELRETVSQLIFGNGVPESRGAFADPDKPVLFAMSRLDRVKNMAGLVEWYATSPELQDAVNLFVVGGHVDPGESDDDDELGQIRRLHELFDEYDLEPKVRWVLRQTDKMVVAELYRVVADTHGAFVQPALFEAFGLTVIEAMVSGLPTFVTRYGGPLEIVKDGVSGFHIDPSRGATAAKRIAEFFDTCRRDPDHWTRISTGAIERVESRYTWKRYAHRLLRYSRIYGFWRYITNIEREETRRYLEMFYGLMYRPLANGKMQRTVEAKPGR